MSKSIAENLEELRSHMRAVYGSPFGPSKLSDIDIEIPADYATFLSEIGGGVIGEMFFYLYETPALASEIYGEALPEHLRSVIIIGDDYSAYCIGLDASDDWKVVEIDKHTHALEVVADNLLEFLTSNWRTDPSDEER